MMLIVQSIRNVAENCSYLDRYLFGKFLSLKYDFILKIDLTYLRQVLKQIIFYLQKETIFKFLFFCILHLFHSQITGQKALLQRRKSKEGRRRRKNRLNVKIFRRRFHIKRAEKIDHEERIEGRKT